MAALEWGMFPYAEGVLDNYLTYFVRSRGRVLYRGLEMAQLGRLLTVTAMYYAYTGDAALLLRHVDKLAGVAGMLAGRRAAALAAFPDPAHPRHGMPTGNDEADMFFDSVQGRKTELPYISIAAEMWRGFRDLGSALTAAAAGNGSATAAVMLGRNLTAAAPPILADFQRSMRLSAVPGRYPRCRPYVAGDLTCGELNASEAGSARASEPWRTYSEALYSGGVERPAVEELLAWHQTAPIAGGAGLGSRLKLGIPSGSGSDVSSGGDLSTFTVHGWGYGLLQADLIEPFLLQAYALSAHAYTRGTWVAPESSLLDRDAVNVPFATPAGLTAPLLLKWALVFEHPITHTVWIGRAVPRDWLDSATRAAGVVAAEVPTAYGRLGLTITPLRRGEIRVAVTAPAEWGEKMAARPPGGLAIRVRTPGRLTIASVTVGGAAWSTFNVTLEAVLFPSTSLTPNVIAGLQSVVLRYA